MYSELTGGAWSGGRSSSSALPERRLSSESDPLSEWTDWECLWTDSLSVLLLVFTVGGTFNVLFPPWASDTMATIVFWCGGEGGKGKACVINAAVAMAAYMHTVMVCMMWPCNSTSLSAQKHMYIALYLCMYAVVIPSPSPRMVVAWLCIVSAHMCIQLHVHVCVYCVHVHVCTWCAHVGVATVPPKLS